MKLHAWLIRFQPATEEPIQEWTRFYPDQLTADAGARNTVYREYTTDAVIVSVALAAVAVKEERYPITEELAAALAAERNQP